MKARLILRAARWFADAPELAKLKAAYVLWRAGGWRGFSHRLRRRFADPALEPAPCLPLTLSERDRLIVYSAAFGEAPLPAALTSEPPPETAFVCFTDRARDTPPRGWRIREIDGVESDPIRAARRVKALPEDVLPDHDYSVWIDSDLSLRVCPRRLAASSLGLADVATFRHPERDCLYREAEVVRFLGLDDPALVRRQLRRYRRSGFPARAGLCETSLLVRRRSKACESFNRHWWREMRNGSRRDQLSFMVALHTAGVAYNLLEGGREASPLVNYSGEVRAT